MCAYACAYVYACVWSGVRWGWIRNEQCGKVKLRVRWEMDGHECKRKGRFSPVARVPHSWFAPRATLDKASHTRCVLSASPTTRRPREDSVWIDRVAVLGALPLLHGRRLHRVVHVLVTKPVPEFQRGDGDGAGGRGVRVYKGADLMDVRSNTIDPFMSTCLAPKER